MFKGEKEFWFYIRANNSHHQQHHKLMDGME